MTGLYKKNGLNTQKEDEKQEQPFHVGLGNTLALKSNLILLIVKELVLIYFGRILLIFSWIVSKIFFF